MTLSAFLLNAAPLEITFADFPRILKTTYAATPLGLSAGPSRFSSPSSAFQVLYAADGFETAFAEAIVRDRFVGRERRYIGRSTLAARSVTLISTQAPLHLFDARDPRAYDLGIDTDALRARQHTAGQAFSEALYAETPLDGILYESRLTRTVCVAVYDRAIAKVRASRAIDLIRHAGLTSELRRLGVIVRRP